MKLTHVIFVSQSTWEYFSSAW